MSLIAKGNEGGSFTPVPAGMHLARCYKIVDLGSQKSEYMGQVKIQHKVMLQFEVWSEDEQGKATVTQKGEPLSISKNYTLTLSDKASLRADLKTWRGRDFTVDELRGFELKNVLGVWAMLSVTRDAGRDGKEYTNIQAIMPVPAHLKKAGLPEPHNTPAMYSIEDHDAAIFETLSENVKKKIMASPEFQSIGAAAPFATSAVVEDDDDIPFN
jgi:hypothetical protein